MDDPDERIDLMQQTQGATTAPSSFLQSARSRKGFTMDEKFILGGSPTDLYELDIIGHVQATRKLIVEGKRVNQRQTWLYEAHAPHLNRSWVITEETCKELTGMLSLVYVDKDVE